MSQPKPRQLSTQEKAFAINLDAGRYGTFAEIGAGQEVVRWFFQAGGAAGTISKSISAYDMQVSDAIYGECQRYVSRQRLESMLQYEQQLTRERLSVNRGTDSSFFTFADTVSARNYLGTNECHAWMGIRFQAEPNADDSIIILHVRMLDDNNAAQQEALGVIGVNLIYGAYEQHQQTDEMVACLVDGLSPGRVEIDMIDCSGPAFKGVDNRVMTLRLVQLGLTGAAMFSASGEVLQPSEALRKKPLLVQRGRFRPLTHVNMDILETARKKLAQSCGDCADDILPIMEISMHNLMEDSQVCLEDFVSRADVVSTTGCTVMVSDFPEHHRLVAYLSRYTSQPIGLAMGLATLRNLFEEKYYKDLDGGILEGFGRIFKHQIQLLIYPLKNRNSGKLEGLDSLKLDMSLQQLLNYLVGRQCIVPLEGVAEQHLDIRSPDVLRMIESGDEEWISMVPPSVASIIKDRRLFGYSHQI